MIDIRYQELAEKFLASNQSDHDFKTIAREVGFERVPKKDSKAVLAALEQARVPQEELDPDTIKLNELLANEDDPDWQDLNRLSKRVLAKIGTGIIKSTTGQVAALKEIIARAEGRIGAENEEGDDKTHVLILPVEDTGEGPSVIVPPNLEE